MGEGFDLLSAKKKLIKNQLLPKKDEVVIEQPQHKIDETTQMIRNVVFARDPTILEQDKSSVNRDEAFQHENYLDVKTLIRTRELMADEEQSPQARAALRMNRKNKMQFDAQVYKLTGPEDRTLLFESRFESGNLYLAQKVSD